MSETCGSCGKKYNTIYRVPNRIWTLIAPKPDTLGPYIEHQGGGLLCVDCASHRAAERGITLYFEASVDDWAGNKKRILGMDKATIRQQYKMAALSVIATANGPCFVADTRDSKRIAASVARIADALIEEDREYHSSIGKRGS